MRAACTLAGVAASFVGRGLWSAASTRPAHPLPPPAQAGRARGGRRRRGRRRRKEQGWRRQAQQRRAQQARGGQRGRGRQEAADRHRHVCDGGRRWRRLRGGGRSGRRRLSEKKRVPPKLLPHTPYHLVCRPICDCPSSEEAAQARHAARAGSRCAASGECLPRPRQVHVAASAPNRPPLRSRLPPPPVPRTPLLSRWRPAPPAAGARGLPSQAGCI